MTPIWSRPRTPLLLGAAACAACCGVPLVAILGGAGAAATAALILEPLAAALVVAAVVVAVIAARRHRDASACALPVGCTLPAADMPGRGDDFQRLFRRAVHREVDGTRAVWTFPWSPELEREARALALAEQGCCSFWRFDLRRDGDHLRWEASVPPDRADAIALLDDIARASMPSSPRA